MPRHEAASSSALLQANGEFLLMKTFASSMPAGVVAASRSHPRRGGNDDDDDIPVVIRYPTPYYQLSRVNVKGRWMVDPDSKATLQNYGAGAEEKQEKVESSSERHSKKNKKPPVYQPTLCCLYQREFKHRPLRYYARCMAEGHLYLEGKEALCAQAGKAILAQLDEGSNDDQEATTATTVTTDSALASLDVPVSSRDTICHKHHVHEFGALILLSSDSGQNSNSTPSSRGALHVIGFDPETGTIAVDKPPGLATHPVGRHNKNTALWLLQRWVDSLHDEIQTNSNNNATDSASVAVSAGLEEDLVCCVSEVKQSVMTAIRSELDRKRKKAKEMMAGDGAEGKFKANPKKPQPKKKKKSANGDDDNVGLVVLGAANRLDKATGGIVLFSTVSRWARALQDTMAGKTQQATSSTTQDKGDENDDEDGVPVGVRKVYLAEVQGDFTLTCQKENEETKQAVNNLDLDDDGWITVDAPIGLENRPAWKWCALQRHQKLDDWPLFPLPAGETEHPPPPKPALSSFKHLSYNPALNTSLVECIPHTGRTHQLRVHLAHLGSPIVHDTKYGWEEEEGEKGHTQPQPQDGGTSAEEEFGVSSGSGGEKGSAASSLSLENIPVTRGLTLATFPLWALEKALQSQFHDGNCIECEECLRVPDQLVHCSGGVGSKDGGEKGDTATADSVGEFIDSSQAVHLHAWKYELDRGILRGGDGSSCGGSTFHGDDMKFKTAMPPWASCYMSST